MKKLWGIGLFVCLSHLSWAQNFYLFAGSYTGEGSKGIYVYQFDSKTGKAKRLSSTDSTINPSFLTVSADGKFIYSVNETGGNDFRAKDNESLSKIYADIDQLEKSKIETSTFSRYKEEFYPFAIAVVVLLLIEAWLRYKVLRKFP